MLTRCIMRLLRLKLDAFHCALLVAIVLLAVYAFGSFREGVTLGRLTVPGGRADPLPPVSVAGFGIPGLNILTPSKHRVL